MEGSSHSLESRAMPLPLDQIVSLIGASLILAAFAMSNLGKWDAKSVPYQALNALGGCCLAYTAIVGHQFGFILLEGTWTLLSLFGLLRALRAPTRAS